MADMARVIRESNGMIKKEEAQSASSFLPQGVPRVGRAASVITSPSGKVGRLRPALLLPTSSRKRGWEACKPPSDPASRITKCGL